MTQQSGHANRSEKGLLTPDNCVLTLIDLQPQMLFGVANFDRQTIINNNVALSKATRVFNVPVILSTVETKGFSGNMWPQIQAVFPKQTPIERSSMNSWDDENFVAAVQKSGRKKIVLTGLWTETCVALPTIQAIHDGYEVYVVEDCCGDVIQLNAKVATNRVPSFVEAVAIEGGKILAMGTSNEVLRHRGPATLVIDARGRTVIPGLNDSHLHLIRGGLTYNMELRWDGVPSLADALRMLREQAQRTPPPQWVRVVGGWTEFQFQERRMPTLQEINAVSPDTPVFVLHLYDRAILNGAALRACGYTKDTPNPPGGEIQRDRQGNPTGLLIARPNAMILYATLAKGPKLPPDQQENSTRQFMRELNRLGVTGVIDAGGGFQNYPDDYQVIEGLHRRGEMTVRIAYNLFTQRPKQELEDFSKWVKMTRPGVGSGF